MWNWLNQNAGGLQLLAILIALFGLFEVWIREKRNKYRKKRNLLEAIKLELYFNKEWVQDLISQGEDAARYYDPTRANFRLRDDAITYAITNGQSILLSEKDLIQKLIAVSHAVRFVNQQIEEQMMVRFCSPEFSSKMSSLVIKNRKVIFSWFKNPDLIPDEFKEYVGELHLRHWAINDIGLWKQLKPSLKEVMPVVDKLIEEMDKNKKWWHFWKS